MDEIESEAEKTTEKMPWQTRWAKRAFVYSLIAWGFLIVSPFAYTGIFLTLPASFTFGLISFTISIVVLTGILFKKRQAKGLGKAITGLLLSLLLIAVFAAIPFIITYPRYIGGKLSCKSNLIKIKDALNEYNKKYGQYPPADKWCDLLVQDTSIRGCYFACVGAWEERYHQTVNKNTEPNSQWDLMFSYRDPNGKVSYVKRGYYAINPSCEPNSPNNIVLLFETKGGWNQFGGPEIVTTDWHRKKGCNVLFNDGHVEFVKPNKIGKLKWKAE
jgi:prepilin-type processing-associated H-X9-DG protein